MSWWTGLLNIGIDKVVKTAGEAIDDLVTSDEERNNAANEKLRIELEAARAKDELEAKMDVAYLEDSANLREQIKVEIQSGDPFVRRARPGMLWALIAVVLYVLIALPTISLVTAGKAAIPDLPIEFWAFTGAMYLGYGWLRFLDKKTAANGKK